MLQVLIFMHLFYFSSFKKNINFHALLVMRCLSLVFNSGAAIASTFDPSLKLLIIGLGEIA